MGFLDGLFNGYTQAYQTKVRQRREEDDFKNSVILAQLEKALENQSLTDDERREIFNHGSELIGHRPNPKVFGLLGGGGGTVGKMKGMGDILFPRSGSQTQVGTKTVVQGDPNPTALQQLPHDIAAAVARESSANAQAQSPTSGSNLPPFTQLPMNGAAQAAQMFQDQIRSFGPPPDMTAPVMQRTQSIPSGRLAVMRQLDLERGQEQIRTEQQLKLLAANTDEQLKLLAAKGYETVGRPILRDDGGWEQIIYNPATRETQVVQLGKGEPADVYGIQQRGLVQAQKKQTEYFQALRANPANSSKSDDELWGLAGQMVQREREAGLQKTEARTGELEAHTKLLETRDGILRVTGGARVLNPEEKELLNARIENLRARTQQLRSGTAPQVRGRARREAELMIAQEWTPEKFNEVAKAYSDGHFDEIRRQENITDQMIEDAEDDAGGYADIRRIVQSARERARKMGEADARRDQRKYQVLYESQLLEKYATEPSSAGNVSGSSSRNKKQSFASPPITPGMADKYREWLRSQGLSDEQIEEKVKQYAQPQPK